MTTSSRPSYKLYLDVPKKYFQFLLYNNIYGEKCLRLSSDQYRHYRYALILAHASSCVEIPLVLKGV